MNNNLIMKKVDNTARDSTPLETNLHKPLTSQNTFHGVSQREPNASKLYESVLNEESISLKVIEGKDCQDEIRGGNFLIQNEVPIPKQIYTRNRSETFTFDKLSNNLRSLNKKNVITMEPLERRYNKSNIDKGKNFFKLRYIWEKFQDLMNLNKKAIESIEDETTKGNNTHNQIEFDANGLNAILNEDKNAIKFNSLFLQKLDKGIFSFNLKKYEDAFNYLQSSGIVKDEAEFGELLLVITGFDKYIVGDFLSKEKVPNKEKKVLSGFMRGFDFKKVKFLDAFRFLLSRLNLPKDASLILNIIDVFSSVYYEDNKDLFKDTNSIYLLSSSVLTLNTLFSRSDIQSLKVLKKEEFIKMNKEVSKTILEQIYDELKVDKMDIVYDYNEVVYRRMSFEANPHNFLSNEEGQVKKQTTEVDPEPNGEEVIALLKQGETFTKYGKHGDPHPRVVKLSDDEKRVIWSTPSTCSLFKKTKFIEVADIKDVYIGIASSRNFEKFKISPNYDPNCFSITCSKRSLDLRHNDENTTKKWFHSVKFLLRRTKSIAELKNKGNLKDTINKKEIVSDIWKTEILPHWHLYRKFVTVKRGKESKLTNKDNKEATKKYREKFAKIINIFKPKQERMNHDKILEEKSEFLYLWTLGVPDWLRRKLWALVIGNESGVTENLFNFHLKEVESVNFEDLAKLVVKNGRETVDTVNYYKSLSNFNTIVPKPKLHVSEDPILNEVINDVIKAANKFSFEIDAEGFKSKDFMLDLFKVVRVFTLFRPDITYSKQITYISAVLLLNSENYYSAFVSLVNFSISSFVMKFLTRDEFYIRIRLDFFEKLIKSYLPAINKHFTKMDVTTSLYFFNWIDYIFIKIWDIYLLKGEVLLYEIGLCIIKIQEKNLLRYTVKDVLKKLKKLSVNVNEDEFFDTLQEIDISADYKTLIYENNLAREKGLLFQSFMIEWI